MHRMLAETDITAFLHRSCNQQRCIDKILGLHLPKVGPNYELKKTNICNIKNGVPVRKMESRMPAVEKKYN